jgi:chromosome segregation ATPase
MKSIYFILSIFFVFVMFTGCGPSKKEVETLQNRLSQLNIQLNTLNSQLETAKDNQGWLRSIFSNSDEVKRLKSSIKSTKKEIGELEYQLSDKNIFSWIKYNFTQSIIVGVLVLVVFIILAIGMGGDM